MNSARSDGTAVGCCWNVRCDCTPEADDCVGESKDIDSVCL